MRETDRVAIHEAMEQQTISIAKAGITTMLNCRNSVLAAANPIHGRYDDLKDIGDNINLMSTILSRFDCIFIIRDVRDEERDKSIAKHVLGVHVNSSLSSANNAMNNKNTHNSNNMTNANNDSNVDIPPHLLKKFICYCRERCAPRLNEEAQALLSGQYVHIRNQVRENLLNKAAHNSGNNRNNNNHNNRHSGSTNPGYKSSNSHDSQQVVPITIRQLEAIIRLSESLAKMRLSPEATIQDVEEALRLFRVSTFAASQSNPLLMSMINGTTFAGNNNLSKDIQVAEDYLRRRIARQVTVSAKKIIEEAQLQGYTIEVMKTGIRAMVMRGEMQELKQGTILRRL
jgi:DNA replication licensing factor MCM5